MSPTVEDARTEIEEKISERVGVEATLDGARLDDLDGQTLTLQDAIRISLFNNPDLKRHMASLGFGAAELYAASRIRNPILSLSVLEASPSVPNDQITWGLVASFTDLLTLQRRRTLAELEFATLQQNVSHAALETVRDTKLAFYNIVAASAGREVAQHIATAGDVMQRLAQRFYDAGNFTPKELAEKKAEGAEAALGLVEADRRLAEARFELAQILGIEARDNWLIEPVINVPRASEFALPELLAAAAANRFDLEAAKVSAKQHTKHRALKNWERWLEDFELGYEREKETDGSRLEGPEIGIAIPLTSRNRDQVLQAQSHLEQALIELEATRVGIVNEVWLAHQGLQAAATGLEQARGVLQPAMAETRKRAQEEQNFMLMGVFDVMHLRMQEYEAAQAVAESLLHYWEAIAHLSYAVGAEMEVSVADEAFQLSDYLGGLPDEQDSQDHHNHHHQGHHR